jgi:hypothetical protein
MKPFASTASSSHWKQLAPPESPHKTRFSLVTSRWTQVFITSRSLRKSLRAAELAFWQATGGDFLRTSHPS